MPCSGSKWKTTRCSQYSVSVQNRYPPAIQATASTPRLLTPMYARIAITGANSRTGTTGWTRVKRSRKSFSNIRGEALRRSDRRTTERLSPPAEPFRRKVRRLMYRLTLALTLALAVLATPAAAAERTGSRDLAVVSGTAAGEEVQLFAQD